jgi:hypothetical protein
MPVPCKAARHAGIVCGPPRHGARLRRLFVLHHRRQQDHRGGKEAERKQTEPIPAEAARQKAEEDARAVEAQQERDMQAGKEAASRFIEAQLRATEARVTRATNPRQVGGRWEVVAKLRAAGHGQKEVLWSVTFTRTPDGGNPNRSFWTAVDSQVYPP